MYQFVELMIKYIHIFNFNILYILLVWLQTPTLRVK